jgi:hypothetical protein
MGPPSYMRSVVDRSVVMRRMTVYRGLCLHEQSSRNVKLTLCINLFSKLNIRGALCVLIK